jgi:hypothetical protein
MKINILIAALVLACALSACKDEKAEEKAQLNEVLKVHDRVMGKSDQVIQLKNRLDSIVQHMDTMSAGKSAGTAKDIIGTRIMLVSADDAMEDWMHKFNADNTGKSHVEIMDYLSNERIKLLKIDSLMTLSINQAKKISK